MHAAVLGRMDVSELVAAHERFLAAMAAFLQQPQGFGAGHRNDAGPALDELEIERPVFKLPIDVGRRVLVQLRMGQAVMGLRFVTEALR